VHYEKRPTYYHMKQHKSQDVMACKVRLDVI